MRTVKMFMLTLGLMASTGLAQAGTSATVKTASAATVQTARTAQASAFRSLTAPSAALAASAHLPTLRALVKADNYQGMGFKSLQEVQTATLLEPIAVHMIRLDLLQELEPGDVGEGLLEDLDTALYLVKAGSTVRSSISMSRMDGEWQATGFGAALRAQRVEKVRQATSAATGLPSSAFFLVEVPGLYASFLGHNSKEGLMLTAMTDDASLQLKAGQTQKASKLLPSLAQLSRLKMDP